MQIDETVHGCPVAVVHPIVRLEIPALEVKSGPPRDSRLWLRPPGRAMKDEVGVAFIITPPCALRPMASSCLSEVFSPLKSPSDAQRLRYPRARGHPGAAGTP